LYGFLRDNFLVDAGRFFIFSSHEVATVAKVSEYFYSFSNRPVQLFELPLITSVSEAANIFNVCLTERDALFYGLIPALIHELSLSISSGNFGHLPYQKQGEVISNCIESDSVNDDTITSLLSSFITGERSDILDPLLQLMNTAENGKVRWIPFHMIEVLSRFSKVPSVSAELKYLLKIICGLFSEFRSAKERSGDAWEVLFLIVILIRSICFEFDEVILPLPAFSKKPTVSYNSPLIDYNVHLLVDVGEYVNRIPKNYPGPHIAVHYPKNAAFDVIIAVYGENNELGQLLAYQLKENSSNPKTNSPKAWTLFKSRLWVRGRPSNVNNTREHWIIPREDQINVFFGQSGKHWTPKRWKELARSDSKSTESEVDDEDISGVSNSKCIVAADSTSLSYTCGVDELLRGLGLALRKIPGDGNCYFASVAFAINASASQGRSDWSAQEVRAAGVYIMINKYFIDDEDTVENRDMYIKRMATDGVWAEGEILIAVSQAYDLAVVVYSVNSGNVIKTRMSENQYLPEVKVFYNGVDHYDAIVNIGIFSYSIPSLIMCYSLLVV